MAHLVFPICLERMTANKLDKADASHEHYEKTEPIKQTIFKKVELIRAVRENILTPRPG